MPCPKCGWMMHDNGKNYFVCENPRCGHMKAIILTVKSQAELIEENKRLKKIIEQMNQEISHNAPETTQD